MDEKQQKRHIRKKMLAIMGDDDSWKNSEEKVCQIRACITEMERITSCPINGKEQPIKIYYPDGLVGKARNITEVALQFGCSKNTIERSLITGEPVTRGLAKDVIFRAI
ncbi:hypothetical protein [Enterococcus sp. AD013-P3]|uniref:hypothetical protein n=1 Tax=Enterococcus sp. AD013-P3 TaxID=3411036 RepID=UPI003B924DDE